MSQRADNKIEKKFLQQCVVYACISIIMQLLYQILLGYHKMAVSKGHHNSSACSKKAKRIVVIKYFNLRCISDVKIKKIQKCNYLSSMMTDDGKCDTEI